MKVTKRPLGQHRMPQHLPYGVLWDNIKCPNICLIGVPKEEEKEKELQQTFEETIAENFPNMGRK